MAIVWADFPSGQHGLYGSTRAYMLNGIWAAFEGDYEATAISIADDIDPNIGSVGRVLKIRTPTSTVQYTSARFTFPVAVATAGVAFRLWMEHFPLTDTTSGNPQWEFRNISNTLIARMRIGASGQFLIYNTAGTLVYTSAPSVVVVNAYNHIETKVLRHASAGTIEIRVNGSVKVDINTQVLGAVDIVNITLGQSGSTGSFLALYYKDLVFWDGAGTAGNDFQGSIAVHDLYTNADISLNWTPSTGATGWNLIDEIPPVDGDYIAAPDPAPAAAVFGLTNLPPDVTSVRCLLPIMRSFKSDGGDCNIQMGLTPDNVAWVNGADRPQTTAFTYWWDAIHTSPVTAAAWTVAEVNAAYARVNRTL